MITRKNYLDGDATFGEYYREIAKEIGLSYENADPSFMKRVRACIDSGDKHLNDIPLSTWDARGASLNVYSGRALAKAFKDRGDWTTLAGLVCLVKQSARDAANA